MRTGGVLLSVGNSNKKGKFDLEHIKILCT